MTAVNPVQEALVSAMTDISHSRYLSIVGSTLVVYDWVIQLSAESQTIMRSKWSFPKIVYYYIRIVTLVFIIFATYELSDLRRHLSEDFCRIWVVLATTSMLSTAMAGNWLFTLRLMALYQRQPFFVWFMRIFFFLTYGATTCVLILALIIYHKTIHYYSSLKVCGTLKSSPMFPALFYAPAAFEFFIFAFTAFRAYRHANIIRIKTFNGKGRAPLLIVLYRDGLICFLVMFAVRSWNIWIYQTQRVTTLNLGVYIMWGINTVMSTRVYLNLVWLTRQPDASSASETTGIAFASLTDPIAPNRLSTGSALARKTAYGNGAGVEHFDTIDMITDHHTDLCNLTFELPDSPRRIPSASKPRRLTRAYDGVHKV